MKYFMVSLQRCESPTSAADPRQVIAQKLRRSTNGGDYGSFVGPYPRITRAAGGACAAIAAEVTMTAAWLFGVPSIQNPPPGYYELITYELMSGVTREFSMLPDERRISPGEVIGAVISPIGYVASRAVDAVSRELIMPTYFNLIIDEYNPSVNGPVEFWESGEAARTATGDRWIANSPRENPIGPNSLIDSGEGALGKYATMAAVVVVAVSTAYVVGKLSGMFSQKPAPNYMETYQESPQRRRRRY